MSSQAVFLDKDGTLIEDVPYNVDPERIQLTAGAAEGLRSLHQAGYQLFVISNQSGVAHGYFPEVALGAVEQRLRLLLVDAPLAGFYYCPHHPSGQVPEYATACACRKPGPGLLLHAAQAHGIDLRRSWLIGDILNDVEAGRRAGCRTILIDNGNETEWLLSPQRLPHHVVTDLAEAARIIQAVDGLTPEGDMSEDAGKGRYGDTGNASTNLSGSPSPRVPASSIADPESAYGS